MMRTTGISLCVLWLACGGGPPRPTPAPSVAHHATTPEAPVRPAPSPEVVAPPSPAASPADRSLFERLGGAEAIAAVTRGLSSRTTSDPRIKERFFNVEGDDLQHQVAAFVCAVAGGPCEYTGRDMESSHARMDLVDDELAAFIEAFAGALDEAAVAAREKRELLGAFAELRSQIVVPADKLRPIDDATLAPVVKLAAKLKARDKAAADLLSLAVLAGKRGQRSYAEQLFSRAEMRVGDPLLAPVAAVFRAGAPPRVTTAVKRLPDLGAQPKIVGSSERDAPDRRPPVAWLRGSIRVDGNPPTGLGVVTLWPERGGKKRVAKQRIIEQRGKAFAPHVMAVPVGSRVSFPNFDPIFHNVFSLSKTKSFDLGMYKSGETREVTLDKPGIVRLGCNLHASMSAYVIVVDAPHYVVVDSDGTYSFKSLAPGRYKVQAWNELSGGPATITVTVKPGANEGNLELRAGGQAIGPDKFGTSR